MDLEKGLLLMNTEKLDRRSGILNIETSERNGGVVASFPVDEEKRLC